MGTEAEFGLIGIHLDERPPVGRIWMRLRPGTTAIYGKNGVGKTRLLVALSKLFDPDSYTPDRNSELSEELPAGFAVERAKSPTSALYFGSAIHYRWPLTRSMWEDRTASSPILAPLSSATHLWCRRGGTRGWGWEDDEAPRPDWDEVLLYVMGRLRLDISVEAVEHLLEQGCWMVSRKPSAPAYLCDPDPLGGPLAEHWAQATARWVDELRAPSISTELRYQEDDEPGPEEEPYSPHEQLALSEMGAEHFKDPPRLPPPASVVEVDEPPSWFAPPVACVVTLDRHNPVTALVRENPTDDVIQATIQHLGGAFTDYRSWLPIPAGSKLLGAMTSIRERMGEYQNIANRLLAQLFEDPPLLTLNPTELGQWFVGKPAISWTARNDMSARDFELAGLGSAHRRYANFAIQRSLQRLKPSPISFSAATEDRASPAFCIIDEPEAALHPSAQRYLAQGLRALAEFVIVATHSTEVIDAADHVLHATRTAGSSLRVEELSVDLTPDQRQFEARRLGQTTASLAALTRIVVLAEGAMDVKVIGSFLEPELASCRALLLPMHGTKEVPGLASSEYLFHATDAPIVVALDNVNAKILVDLRQRLLNASSLEQTQLLNRARKEDDVRKSSEMKKLLGLFDAACEANRLNRIHVFGFRKRDIVEYLPVTLIKPGAQSWEQLWKDFRGDNPGAIGPGSGKQFKTYVGPGYTVRGVEAAIDRMHLDLKAGQSPSSRRPVEFSRLADLLVELAQRP